MFCSELEGGGGRLVTFRGRVSGDHVDVNGVEFGVLDGAPHPVRLGQSERRLAHHDRDVGGGVLHCQDYCPAPVRAEEEAAERPRCN